MREVIGRIVDLILLPLRLAALVISAPLHFLLWFATKTWFVIIPLFYFVFGFFFCGFAYFDELSDFTIPLYLKGLQWYFAGGNFKQTYLLLYSTFFNKWWKIPLYFFGSFTACYYLPKEILDKGYEPLYDFGTAALYTIEFAYRDIKWFFVRLSHILFHTELPFHYMTQKERERDLKKSRQQRQKNADVDPTIITDRKEQREMLEQDYSLLSDDDFFRKYLVTKEEVKRLDDPLSVFDRKMYGRRLLDLHNTSVHEGYYEEEPKDVQKPVAKTVAPSSPSHVLTKAKNRAELIEQIKTWTDDEFTGFYHMTKLQAAECIKASIQKQQGK